MYEVDPLSRAGYLWRRDAAMFSFETREVPVPLIKWVEERVGQELGGWVFGRIGSGKSHAVRKATQGGSRRMCDSRAACSR